MDPVPDGRGESGRLFSLMLILQIIAIIAPVVTHVHISAQTGGDIPAQGGITQCRWEQWKLIAGPELTGATRPRSSAPPGEGQGDRGVLLHLIFTSHH